MKINLVPRYLSTILIVFCALLIVIAMTAIPGVGTPQETTLKQVSPKPSDPNSGPQMYIDYCAVCHGLDGKGIGPAAPALKMPATDLTQLAKKNGGKFPSEHVGSVLEFGVDIPAHGSKDMPIWGPLFRSMGKGNTAQGYSNQRISNITKYLEMMQVK